MSHPAVGRWLLIVAGMVVVATVVMAVISIGSPHSQQLARQDERRVRDLDVLEDEIREWGKDRSTLPTDLASLAGRPGVRLSVADPVTSVPYPYEVLSARTFRLCATFETDTAEIRPGRWDRPAWRHPRGKYCFDRVLEREDGAAEK